MKTLKFYAAHNLASFDFYNKVLIIVWLWLSMPLQSTLLSWAETDLAYITAKPH